MQVFLFSKNQKKRRTPPWKKVKKGVAVWLGGWGVWIKVYTPVLQRIKYVFKIDDNEKVNADVF